MDGVGEVGDLNAEAVTQRQHGVGLDKSAEATTISVHLDETFSTRAAVGMTTIVVARHERDIGRNTGKMNESIIEGPQRHIAQMPKLVA